MDNKSIDLTEEKVPVRVFIVRKRCPVCALGHMEQCGPALMAMPPQYPHQCPSCGHRDHYRTTYPDLEYEEIEDEQDAPTPM